MASDMDCCICYHAYDLLERMVPCGHSVCSACARGATACPMCRAPLPHERGASLPNIALQGTLAADEGSADRAQLLDAGITLGDGLFVPAEEVVLTAEELGSGSSGRVVAGVYNRRQVRLTRLAKLQYTPDPRGRMRHASAFAKAHARQQRIHG